MNLDPDEKSSLKTDYLIKYLGSINEDFKDAILYLYNNNDFINIVKLKDKDRSMNKINEWRNHVLLSSKNNTEEYSFYEILFNDMQRLYADLFKLQKILQQENLFYTKNKIFELLFYSIFNERKKELSKFIKPFIIRYNNTKYSSIKDFIKDFIFYSKITPEENEYIPFLLSELNIDIPYDLESLIKQSIDEIEIEKFKNNLLKPDKGINDFEDIQNGIEFEDYLKYYFERNDYNVTKTKISGDFGADLLIENENEKVVIQAKNYSGSVGVNAIQEVVGSIKYYNAKKGMVITTGHFTKNAIELGYKNDIELWDHDKLKEKINQYNNNKKISNIIEVNSKLYLDRFEMQCPICLSLNKLFYSNIKLDKDSKYYCSECETELKMNFKIICCNKCNNNYDNMSEFIEHLNYKHKEKTNDQVMEIVP